MLQLLLDVICHYHLPFIARRRCLEWIKLTFEWICSLGIIKRYLTGLLYSFTKVAIHSVNIGGRVYRFHWTLLHNGVVIYCLYIIALGEGGHHWSSFDKYNPSVCNEVLNATEWLMRQLVWLPYSWPIILPNGCWQTEILLKCKCGTKQNSDDRNLIGILL